MTTNRLKEFRDAKVANGYTRRDVWLSPKAQAIAERRPRSQSISDYVSNLIVESARNNKGK